MKNLIIIIIVGFVSFSSCKKGTFPDCFYATGDITTQSREIEKFSKIILRNNVNLILEKSNTNNIVVEAGTNLISNISTLVNENGVLEIKNDNNCNWIRSFDKPINVYLKYTNIDTIEYQSIGDVTTKNALITDTLWLAAYEGAGEININVDVKTLHCALHYGTLDIIIKGKSGLSYVYSASFGLVNLIELESKFVYANNKSSNDVYLKANSHLGATIENIGNIYYAGNPKTVTFDKIGTGELIHLPD